jgi:hypothetical protein
LADDVKELLCLNLVMYYNEVKSQYPNNIICQTMLTSMVTDLTLKEWSTTVKEKFNLQNKVIKTDENPSFPPNEVVQPNVD